MTMPVEPSLSCLSLRRYAMLEYQPNIVLAAQEYTGVGKRPVRPDGVAKVTGRATYGADIFFVGMLAHASAACTRRVPRVRRRLSSSTYHPSM